MELLVPSQGPQQPFFYLEYYSNIDMNSERQTINKRLAAKQDELHYLDQVYKYLKFLEQGYNVGVLKDEEKAWQINISLLNIGRQRDKLLKEIGENDTET